MDHHDSSYLALAPLVELAVPAQYAAGTHANFERTAALARLVMEFPLPAHIEPAARYSLERYPQ